MKPVVPNPDLLSLAPRIMWFESPQQALSDPVRFLAYLMTYGTPEDIAIARRYFTLKDFGEALENAPPGVIDQRSWAYWHAIIGRYPPPPMPRRRIPGAS
jgi:hypothetical protein